jgi:hypothetical protein
MKPEKIFSVFQKRGLDAMIQVYRSNMRSFSYRVKQYAWQGLTGVRFLHFLNQINTGAKRLSDTTMAESAADTLERLDFAVSVDWRIDRSRLKSYPIIFYAKHPGYIEPIVCMAALKEFNPKAVATAWVLNISEAVSHQIIPVPDSKEATLRGLRRYKGVRRLLETIWAYMLIFNVIKYLQGDMSPDECKRRRLLAISNVVSALSEKESVLIFPSGGEAQKPWVNEHTEAFEKLLRIIIAGRTRAPALEELRFVPLITKNSLRALYKSQVMMPWHPLSLLFRMLPDRPFQFVIQEQIALKNLLARKKNAKDIVNYLMQRLVI